MLLLHVTDGVAEDDDDDGGHLFVFFLPFFF